MLLFEFIFSSRRRHTRCGRDWSSDVCSSDLTGDFNAVPDSEPIQIILKDGFLNDSYEATLQPPYGTKGTFNSFRLNSPMDNRIDYIWVSKDIMVNKYGVLNDVHYGHFPSDHFPVVVNLSF